MPCEQSNTPRGSEEEKYKKLLELRKIRGYSILAKGDTPVIVDEETFFVPSQSDNSRKYKVVNLNGWSCECEDFKQRHLECKHIQSIRIFLQVRSSQDAAVLELKQELNKEVVNCSFCGSNEVMKRGKRKTATGVKQRYKCKACNRRFVPDLISRVKVDAKMICFIMDVYYKGLSLRDIKDSVKQFFGVELHHETIRQYILKFTSKISQFTSHYTPDVSNKWHVDEQKVKTKKEKKWLWAWNVLDSKTRFLIANNVTPETVSPN
jgi:transposase-like protein